MGGSVEELSVYRMEKSRKNIELAETLYKDEVYFLAANRAYYAAFYAMRAVNALDGYDSSKHSGVISHFNQYHVKTGDFDMNTSRIIRRASRLRERSDYEDFFEPEQGETEIIIDEVSVFIGQVEAFLRKRGVLKEDRGTNSEA